MTYEVKLSPHAVRDYKKLDPQHQVVIRTALETLRSHPLSGPNVKRLKGRLHEYFCYRTGDYRIVYAVDQSHHAVYVDYIQHRKDIYRHFN